MLKCTKVVRNDSKSVSMTSEKLQGASIDLAAFSLI